MRAATIQETEQEERKSALTGIGLWTLLAGGFIANYTFSSVNVALPYIQEELSAGSAAAQLVMGAYVTCFALLLIIGGRLGDALGRHRLFGIGLAMFAGTTLATGISGTIGWLIAFRALQGFAAALLVPQILATIQATTHGAQRARVVALFSALCGVGTAAGQFLGGLLLSANIGGSSWRSVLWFGALIALLALPGIVALPKTRSDSRSETDIVGAVLIGCGVVALLLPLNVAPSQDWPLWTIALLVISPVFIASFWQWERRHEVRGKLPLVPPTVLRHPAVRMGLVMATIYFAGYGAFMYEFALTVQHGLHYTALDSGLALGLFTVAFTVVSVALPLFRRWFGSYIMVIGSGMMIVGLISSAAIVAVGWPDPSQWLLQLALILLGSSQALLFAPMVGVVMSEVPEAVAGLTGGLFSTTQQAALGLGVAVYGGVFASVTANPDLSFPGAFAICLGIQAACTAGYLVLAMVLRRRTMRLA